MKKLKLPKPFNVAEADEIESNIPANMEIGSLGDWFLHVDGKPKMYFNDMLKLCSTIVKAPLTKKYAPSMYLEDGLKFDEKPVELKERGFRGAKRVNAAMGEYIDIGDPMMSILTGLPQEHTTRRTEENQFFLHGKDEGCLVEGTWYDWLCFVGNVLASETTKHNYPDLHQPQLANDNY
jgi:hypothetical protein